MITLSELLEQLKKVEETYLIELLNLSSEDIVDRFGDIIERDFDYLSEELAGVDYPGADPFSEGLER